MEIRGEERGRELTFNFNFAPSLLIIFYFTLFLTIFQSLLPINRRTFRQLFEYSQFFLSRNYLYFFAAREIFEFSLTDSWGGGRKSFGCNRDGTCAVNRHQSTFLIDMHSVQRCTVPPFYRLCIVKCVCPLKRRLFHTRNRTCRLFVPSWICIGPPPRVSTGQDTRFNPPKLGFFFILTPILLILPLSFIIQVRMIDTGLD